MDSICVTEMIMQGVDLYLLCRDLEEFQVASPCYQVEWIPRDSKVRTDTLTHTDNADMILCFFFNQTLFSF